MLRDGERCGRGGKVGCMMETGKIGQGSSVVSLLSSSVKTHDRADVLLFSH